MSLFTCRTVLVLHEWKKQEYNEKHNALCLITGEESNLYVVDYDIKEMYEEKAMPEPHKR